MRLKTSFHIPKKNNSMSRQDLSRANKTSAVRLSLLIFPVLSLALSLASARPAQAQWTETVLHSFSALSDGAYPYGTLMQASDGAYYGTTEGGGCNTYGTVFKIDAAGHLTTLRDFAYSDGAFPNAGLIQGRDGYLYGTTTEGGYYGSGTAFKISTDGSVFSTLHSFNWATDGNSPNDALLQGRDGMLYGTTQNFGPSGGGTVFQLSADGSVFNTLHSFNYNTDGGDLIAGVIQGSDGMLYGTTQSGSPNSNGTVFQLSTDGTVFNTLHSFDYGSDGGYLFAGVIQGRDGMLYGTAAYGGPGNEGTVYQISTDGTVFNVLHSFGGSDGNFPFAGVIQASDGMLYGTTSTGGPGLIQAGTVFQLSTDGTVFNTLHSFNPNSEGYGPWAGVFQGSDGLLHGATLNSPYSSATSFGTIFTMDTGGTTYATIYDFANGFHDGRNPDVGTLALGKDGNYYGVSQYGGLYEFGTLYKMTPAGQVTILHSFNFVDGARPLDSIAFDSKGNIYGTTVLGGSAGAGTVFTYSPAASSFTVLYNFDGVTAVNPASGVLVRGASLYGSAYSGGLYNAGAVYRLNLPTATRPLTFHILHTFNTADGANPGALTLGSDKNFYGATFMGGANGCGAVFKISPSGVFATLHNFNGSDGSNPAVRLIQGLDGMLYGTTLQGGNSGDGTVFQMSMDGSIFNTMYCFSGLDGVNPLGALLQASDHLLYGTTLYGGINNTGTVFRLAADGTGFTSLYSFGVSTADGNFPAAGLREGPDGNLYGTTANGGVSTGVDSGTAYKLATHLPLIKSVSPLTGSASAGTILKINGVNLTGATVTIAGVSQTILAGANSTSLKFPLNAATPTGSYPVVVTTTNGTGYSPKNVTVGP